MAYLKLLQALGMFFDLLFISKLLFMGLRINQHAKTSTFIPEEKVVSIGLHDYSVQRSRNHKIFWASVLFIALSWMLMSCKGSGSQNINTTDTAGLAAFNAQKLSDSLQNLPENEKSQAGNEAAGSSSRQSFNGSRNDNSEDGAMKSENSEVANSDDQSTGGASSDEVSSNNESSTSTDQTVSAEPVQKKKKFSSAAKGALIGAGSGAVLGAVVSKRNRGLGAVVGAAVGGGAGYGIGKHKDNKQAQEGN